VANTGYGWGFRTRIGLSEQLMLDLTERLVYGQSATVGQALSAAKAKYYLQEAAWDYYDEKILIESTLYGLPMYRYTTPASLSAPTGSLEPSANPLKEEHLTILGDGLTKNSVSYEIPAFLAETTEEGTYYTFGGMAHSGNGEPIQPKYVADMSFPETEAHGIVFRGGSYADIESFDAVFDQAITETETLAQPAIDGPGWYPPVPQSLRHLEQGDTLVMMLGQYHASNQMERLYDGLEMDTYYHMSSEDWTPPIVPCLLSYQEGRQGDYVLEIEVHDPSDVEAVIVTYTTGDRQWQSLDLVLSDQTWTGSLPNDPNLRYLVQAVDKAGNVRVKANDGIYYTLGESDCSNAIYLPLVQKNH
jgi:hypothetical protein